MNNQTTFAQQFAERKKVDFEWFKGEVKAKGFTIEQLRCDVAPTEELLALMARVGLSRYENWVMRLQA